jgi:hypothetical protein
MNPFETETMAELCLRQGHREEAAGIYRRLLARATDEGVRARLRGRLGNIAGDAVADASLTEPGLRARTAGDQLTVDWRLPAGAPKVALELLLVLRGAAGVVTESRTLPLEAQAGRLVFDVPGLHSAKAAAGFHKDGRFVPVLRA